ncbi:hypothetical protein BC940DRAFT_326388 [Gongronella butleri]|nr:hypothetical protein BC940DRAFT_326388 [Gongronella butleri]
MGVTVVESTFTLAELFALAGLQFTSKTIKTGIKACEESVRLVDGIFGATDTSRAIASIITLVHRELMHDPDFQMAQMGRVAMLSGLTKALTTFALLQAVTHHQRIKQMQSIVLWQGLVIEEETNQQALIQYEEQQHHAPRPPSDAIAIKTSVGESENQSLVLQQLQEILSSTGTTAATNDDEPVLFYAQTDGDGDDASYQMYEIMTTTERTTTKTTRIRPVDPSRPDLPTRTKYITLQSNELDNESFIAFVDPPANADAPLPPPKDTSLYPALPAMAAVASKEESTDDDTNDKPLENVPGVWNKFALQKYEGDAAVADSDAVIHARQPKQGSSASSASSTASSRPNVLLSAVSKKLSRKKMERKESYAWETSEGAHDDALPRPPTRIMTSTSTTLQSTASLVNSHHGDDDDGNHDEETQHQHPYHHYDHPPPPIRKQKSRWGITMDAIRQKSNSISSGAPLTLKKKKSMANQGNSRRNSSGSSSGGGGGFSSMMTQLTPSSSSSQQQHHLQRSNSITSMASISRTTMTTTYTTASASSPPPTPTTSSTPPLIPASNSSNASSRQRSHASSASSSSSAAASTSSSRHRSKKPLPMTEATKKKKKPQTPQTGASSSTTEKPRRIRFIRSMPVIRSSAPRSLEHEPAPTNFPRQHIISNIGHFMRYASAAYGESFMRVFGIGDMPSVLPNSHHHHPNHHAFAHHTGVMVQDILLSSYTDRHSILTMNRPSIHTLVHYVTVDHHTKSIVLTCRGTFGLSDVLTDLSFTYRDFTLPSDPNRHFQAHDGMLDAAQLLAKEKGKVYQVVRDGLEQFPDYGLVLCGHSLGGGVVSLLSVLWSVERHRFLERESTAISSALRHDPVPFVTSRTSGLPAGRPVHCYVYGPPCAMSLELSEYCGQGLVTSVVHGYDIVSCLSWGIVKDLKNIATSLHHESHTAESIISRIIARYNRHASSPNKSAPDANNGENDAKNGDNDPGIHTEDIDDDQWFWATIKTMRADMRSAKLYPPMTVYHVESVPQLVKDPVHYSQSHTANSASRQVKHRKAHMTTLTLVDDIQSRFSEINFSRSMLVDHMPLFYERAIRNLCRGYFGQETAYETS